MMKRTVPRLGPDEPQPLPQPVSQIQQPGASNIHTLAQTAQPQIIGAATMLSVAGGGGFRGSARPGAPAVINYLKAGVQYAPPKQPPVAPRLKVQIDPESPINLKPAPQPLGPALPLHERQSPAPPPGAQGPAAFQRLKVEDALSYLDQVKYKFNTQPQVYNDFLDIMKEFKSQTIDTPGVITRVSNLFKGHPELIVGFNTFLPPGYKIEVQSNGQVSVSMPSPTGVSGGVLLGVHHAPQAQLVHLLPVAPSVSSAIVHNLSVSAAPANTLHHISQAHQQLEAAAIHQQHQQPVSAAPANTLHHISQAHQQLEAAAIHQQHQQPGGVSGGGHPPAPAGQPVEFNHAIEYVNKIKSRFSRQPDKYKRFLEILHAYQRGHRDVKDKQQTEQEVYSQVAKLFENQEDLLAEFGQFLPDAKAVTKPPAYPLHAREPPPQGAREGSAERRETPPPHHAPLLAPPHHAPHAQIPKHPSSVPSAPPPPAHHLKRSPSFTSATQMLGGPPAKKSRTVGVGNRDVSLAEAAKLATAQDLHFFDRARKALRSQHVYDNFLRCLLLFTNEIISSSELLVVAAPFLCRHPELQKWLTDFVGPASPPHTPTHAPRGFNNYSSSGHSSLLSYERLDRERSERPDRLDSKPRFEPVGGYGAQLRHERPQGDAAMDVDLTTCKRLGTSYCALPREAASRRCSGRTALCKEVLNDTWVSFPTWSEDSTFVTSRKTQYEEYIYRCEDERFELDVVIETNAATIRVLEGVQKKLSRMSPVDAAKYRLDECLGGHSPTVHQRALRRIYGDKAVDIIAGLRKNPVVAVPVVLRRLKAKEEEWREAQKGFNKQWREQNEKYYLKSLDHQGINFKQNDLKAMRSKSLFNEVESAYAARRPPPHLVVDYNMTNRQEAIKIVRDCAELLIHHARRQTAIQKAEKRRIKQLLRHFLPDLFAHPRQPLSDDENDEEKEDLTSPGSPAAEDPDKPKDVKEGDKGAGEKVKAEKESSESDAASDKSGKINSGKNDKENKPKNNNTADSKGDKDGAVPPSGVKRSSSNEEVKFDVKDEEDDLRDHPANEARFVCTSSWYLFLRLHGVVCQRLAAARRTALQLAEQEARDNSDRHPSVATALRLRPNNLPAEASSPAEYYNALLELVKGVLDGNTEPAAFEDAAREMLGIKAYPAYTLDKLVSIAVRQLQHCVSEPWSVRACELAARGGMRGPLAYVRRAARYLRQEHTSFLVRVYGGDECRVTYELLEGTGDGRASPHNNDTTRLSPTNQPRPAPQNGEAVSRLAAWSLYTERYVRPHTHTHTHTPRNKPVFLRRCARRCGGFSHNTAAGGGGSGSGGGAGEGPAAVAHARRKPPRLHDSSECTLSHTLRLLASRPHQMYRPGCLRAARASQPRLHAARRARFRAWLRTRDPA